MKKSNFISYKFSQISEEESIQNSEEFYRLMKTRRTVRTFSKKKANDEIIKNCIKTAASAPSGANQQPWHFVVVTDPSIRKKIRDAAEKEEIEFYSGRAPEEWLNALKKFETNEVKPFLEEASHLIIVFQKSYDIDSDGNKLKIYYSKESVGISVGMLLTAIHNAGLVSLTHTPSPMNFLNTILNRPENEKPFLIIAAGYPADDTKVPDIKKKSFEEITTFV
ncbi:MAG: nitroreductase family protein [Melioribacteraceae bacterium]|nr:nitroreductase family protein [Melioribacteraceae bacterium]MCO6474260.1 nitroreductase family protein [Melioribacteraceae bacterium]MDD3558587.1 nitroreductase family protein [Melioribacteraceae bacterium]